MKAANAPGISATFLNMLFGDARLRAERKAACRQVRNARAGVHQALDARGVGERIASADHGKNLSGRKAVKDGVSVEKLHSSFIGLLVFLVSPGNP